MLNAAAIRGLVHAEIRSEVREAVLVDEAPLFGAVADVLMPVALHAFEIKSDIDDLRRFTKQSAALERTFPFVTLVTTQSHVVEALQVIGPSWGLWIVVPRSEGYGIVREREARPHTELQPTWLLGTLRAGELRRIAVANGLPSSGTCGTVASRLLQRLGAAACVRLAHAVLAMPTRWRDIHGPWLEPVLSAMETSLFPLPVR